MTTSPTTPTTETTGLLTDPNGNAATTPTLATRSSTPPFSTLTYTPQFLEQHAGSPVAARIHDGSAARAWSVIQTQIYMVVVHALLIMRTNENVDSFPENRARIEKRLMSATARHTPSGKVYFAHPVNLQKFADAPNEYYRSVIITHEDLLHHLSNAADEAVIFSCLTFLTIATVSTCLAVEGLTDQSFYINCVSLIVASGPKKLMSFLVFMLSISLHIYVWILLGKRDLFLIMVYACSNLVIMFLTFAHSVVNVEIPYPNFFGVALNFLTSVCCIGSILFILGRNPLLIGTKGLYVIASLVIAALTTLNIASKRFRFEVPNSIAVLTMLCLTIICVMTPWCDLSGQDLDQGQVDQCNNIHVTYDLSTLLLPLVAEILNQIGRINLTLKLYSSMRIHAIKLAESLPTPADRANFLKNVENKSNFMPYVYRPYSFDAARQVGLDRQNQVSHPDCRHVLYGKLMNVFSTIEFVYFGYPLHSTPSNELLKRLNHDHIKDDSLHDVIMMDHLLKTNVLSMELFDFNATTNNRSIDVQNNEGERVMVKLAVVPNVDDTFKRLSVYGNEYV